MAGVVLSNDNKVLLMAHRVIAREVNRTCSVFATCALYFVARASLAIRPILNPSAYAFGSWSPH